MPSINESVKNPSKAANELADRGSVRIVYIDQILHPGLAPGINETYGIVRDWSARTVPEIGAQLRIRHGKGVFLSGWVKKKDNSIILKHLENNSHVRGTVTDLEPFWWQNVQCYWGNMDWWVIAEKAPANTTTGGSTSGTGGGQIN
ncbi:uncharacterized protein H6S33_007263 [Morchella sextelata]|uniref:uncharacterized protein n=1 Tax=Morchella sextelata TaxID=1174677 RepID=UPI001D04203B|nr:uncharacterized protein H6S33_007263 [Morchella sextelata]KAH0603604.1 hypothetical protein H6S33_007263 [Morchella sextelata]